MYQSNIISETVETMACDLSGAVEMAPPPHVPLSDYFVNGGPVLMSIITILLIAVLFAAWKAPAWVKDLGILALAASVFMTFMGLYQFFNTIIVVWRSFIQGILQRIDHRVAAFTIWTSGLHCIHNHPYSSKTENIDEQNHNYHSSMHDYDILLPRYRDCTLGEFSVCV